MIDHADAKRASSVQGEGATLSQRIADSIRRSILRGSLREGERLVERKLAAQYGTSLAAVREALIALSKEGFVIRKTNSSTFVFRLSEDEAKRLFILRRLIEGHAVAVAASEATPPAVESLQTQYLALLDAARQADTAAFDEADYAFHEALWRACNDRFLESLARQVCLPLFAFGSVRMHRTRDAFNLVRGAQSHFGFIEAIAAKNPVAAKQAYETAWAIWYEEMLGTKAQADFSGVSPVLPVHQAVEATIR